MLLGRVVTLVSVLAAAPVHALTIKAPESAENGAVIPVEVLPTSPLTSGHQLELLVNGQLAAQLKVVTGKVTAFQTRVKGTRNETVISARVLVNGGEREQGARTVKVVALAPASGAATPIENLKVRTLSGEVKVLVASANGYSGALVLQGAGFRAEVIGSSHLARNPFVGLKGDIAGQVTASIDGQSVSVAQASPPPSAATSPTPPAAATPSTAAAPVAASGKSTKQIADEIGARYDRNISAASEKCKSDMDSCETSCSAQALISVLSKSGNPTQHLECTNQCGKQRDRCNEQVKELKREKRQAIADALAPPAPQAPSSSASSAGTSSGSSSTLSLPKPAKGAVNAPVIPGANTSGPTRRSDSESTVVMAVPGPARSRTLTLPPELASLRPADVFVDFFGGIDINIFVGRTIEAAISADRYIGLRNDSNVRSSCSQMLGKTTVAWFAVLRVAHQLPPIGTKVDHHYTLAFVCGAASMEEAIAGAYEVAKKESGGRPFKTFALQAAVSAEVDPEQLRREKRLHNGLRPVGLAPWTFDCSLPLNLDQAQATFMPRDPGSASAFVQYIKSLPETREFRYRTYNVDRSSTYEETRWLGCKGYYHTPLPNQSPPVFAPRSE